MDIAASPGRAARWPRLRGVALFGLVVAFVTLTGLWSTGRIGSSLAANASLDAPPLPTRTEPLLPDLAMGPIEDIAIGTTPGRNERMRFAATIVNIGAGPLIVRAERPLRFGGEWTVNQLITERDGGYTQRATDATLIFGGDGHDHWHVKGIEVHQLETLDGRVLGSLVKQGFCFFDTDGYRTSLEGSPASAHWGSRGCAEAWDVGVRMGLSVGWGDKYPWHLLDERIPVTGVPDGRYILRQIADPANDFEELDETNNETWVELELGTTADGLRVATVVEAGPPP